LLVTTDAVALELGRGEARTRVTTIALNSATSALPRSTLPASNAGRLGKAATGNLKARALGSAFRGSASPARSLARRREQEPRRGGDCRQRAPSPVVINVRFFGPRGARQLRMMQASGLLAIASQRFMASFWPSLSPD